jgi:hypothetical protein
MICGFEIGLDARQMKKPLAISPTPFFFSAIKTVPQYREFALGL